MHLDPYSIIVVGRRLIRALTKFNWGRNPQAEVPEAGPSGREAGPSWDPDPLYPDPDPEAGPSWA